MPPATPLRNADSDLSQEQFDSRPPQLQNTNQGSKLSNTSPQTLDVAQRSVEETHTSSTDDTIINNCEGSYDRLSSTARSLEAPNHQESCSSCQDQIAPWNSTTAMFQGARGVNIHGQARFFNIMNQLSNPEGSQSFANFERFVSFDALHDSSVQDFDRPVHQVIRDNTLKQLQDWIDNPVVTGQIIWLHGPASIGKTALALEIARSRHGKVAGTFFFSRLDASRNDGNRLFTTLAWQLAVSIPDMKEHIIRSLNERPDLPKKGVEAQFEYLVARPFAAMKEAISIEQPSDLVLIIDGVDECVDTRLQRRLLRVIGSAIRDHRVPLRFIISSRPDACIQESFDQFECSVLGIDLAKFGPAEEIRKREETITRKEEELKKWELKLERREAWIRLAEIKEQDKAQGLMQEISRKRNEEERKLEERMAEIRKKEAEAMTKPSEKIAVSPLLAAPVLDTEPSEEDKTKIKIWINQIIKLYEDAEESFRRKEAEAGKKQKEAEKLEEGARRKQEEAKKLEEEAKRREEEARRKEEEVKVKAEEAKSKEEEAAKKEEEALRRKEDEAKKKEIEARKKEREAHKKEMEANRKESEARRLEEDVRRREEEAERREEDVERREEEAFQEEDVERRERKVLQLAQEVRQKGEEMNKREEELKKREEELERREAESRLEDERQQQAHRQEELRRQQEEEEARQREEEEMRRQVEAKLRVEAETNKRRETEITKRRDKNGSKARACMNDSGRRSGSGKVKNTPGVEQWICRVLFRVRTD